LSIIDMAVGLHRTKKGW